MPFVMDGLALLPRHHPVRQHIGRQSGSRGAEAAPGAGVGRWVACTWPSPMEVFVRMSMVIF